MVHKKYIEKGGKVYGPYLYESYRDKNGRVKKRYIQSGDDDSGFLKNNLTKIFLFVAVILIIVALSFGVKKFNEGYELTGRATASIDPIYKLGDPLSGVLRFNLKEGELIPQNSRVVLTDGINTKELYLSDTSIKAQLLTGNFYAEDSSLTGYGDGFGATGKKVTVPTVQFELLITNSQEDDDSNEDNVDATEETVITDEEVVAEDAEAIEEIPASDSDDLETPSESSESSESESSEAESSESEGRDAGITGNVVSQRNDGITGNVLIETVYTVEGEVSKGNDFSYNLEPGQEAEIVEGSVKVNGQEIGDSNINIQVDGDEVTVSTDYEQVEEGFGEEYLGDYKLVLRIDLAAFDMDVAGTNLNLTLISNGEVIANAQKELIVTSDEDAEKILNEVNTSEIKQSGSNLTALENIPTLRIPFEGETSLNLNDYFSGAESYTFIATNITAKADGQTLILRADPGFKGVARGVIEASDGESSLRSNEFNILVSSGAVGVVTSRSKIKVGEPVKWTKNVTLENPENIVVNLPAGADNIVVKSNDETVQESSQNVRGITGNVAIEISLNKEPRIVHWLKRTFLSITGNVISGEDESGELEAVQVTLDEGAVDYTIEYETPAPESSEEESEQGKIVTISGPDELHYTDVIASSNLDNSIPRDSAEKIIKIYWRNYDFEGKNASVKEVSEVEEQSIVEEESSDIQNSPITGNAINDIEGVDYIRQEVPFDYYDLDNDGNVDYIEWVVPHLSNQTFEIILITRALHLDSSRELIADIYEQVMERDNNWSDPIAAGDYVRVTFERNLTNVNDITLFARSSGASIEVYEKDGNDLVAYFDNITINQKYKVILTNLTNSQDTFDLKILGNSVEFDYIIDPNGELYSCETIGVPGTYILFNDITQGGGSSCFDITSSDVIIEGNGFTITGDSTGGWGVSAINVNNVTIKNLNIINFGDINCAATCNGGGIYFEGVTNSNIIQSGTVISGSRFGVKTLSSSQNYMEGLWIISSSYGLDMETGSDNNHVAGFSSEGNGLAINLYEANNNDISDVSISGNAEGSGIKFYSSQYNVLSSLYIDSTLTGIEMDASNYNNITSFDIPNYFDIASIYLYGSSNYNRFADGSAAFVANVDAAYTTFVGSTIDSEYVEIGPMIRKWYLDAVITDSSAEVISGANVTSYNETGDAEASTLTDGDGNTRHELTEYIWHDGSEKTYYSNYNISVTAEGYSSNSTSVNMSANQNVQISLSAAAPVDTTPPQVAINSPTGNLTISQVTFNVTTNEDASRAMFSLNGGVTNITMQKNGNRDFNYTNSSIANGNYVVNFYVNDTSNNFNRTTSRAFTVDTLRPLVNITIPLNKTNYTTVQTVLNYTVSDINLQACKYSLNGGVTNTTITCGANVTGLTASQGSNTWSVYVNDTSGNTNSSSVTFNVDSIGPATTFGAGTETDASTITRNNIVVNISVIDATSGLANITIRLYNSTSLLYTNVSTTSPFRINYTNLAYGLYYFNSTAYDNYGNVNHTATRNVTLAELGSLNSCQSITTEGRYFLGSDITAGTTCFTINSSDVDLDCKGYTITYGTDGGNNGRGISATATANRGRNLTIRNCVLLDTNAGGSGGVGIYISKYQNSTFRNNSIYTNGTSSNFGIHSDLNSDYAIIANNTIFTRGSSTNNHGMQIESMRNNITGNIIYTNGTTTNTGIRLMSSHNHLVQNNSIHTGGTGGSSNNIGITLPESTNNTVINNYIETSGISINYGISMDITNRQSNNNFSNNIIYTSGTAATNYGFNLAADSRNTSIINNTIVTSGTNSNDGIHLSSNNDNNTILYNFINATGTTTNNEGIFIDARSRLNVVRGNVIYASGTTGSSAIALNGANNTLIEGNRLESSGTSSAHGIELMSAATSSNFGNIIRSNNVTTRGSAATTNNDGISLSRAGENNITGNNIYISSSGAGNDGIDAGLTTWTINNIITNNNIYSIDTSAIGIYVRNNATGNIISHNSVNNFGSEGIRLETSVTGSNPMNNTFINNSLINSTTFDFHIFDAGINGTVLQDQSIGSYNISGTGSIITIENTRFGKITYLTNVSASNRANLSQDIVIGNNSAFVNSTGANGLNRSANVTLYGLPNNFSIPVILKDGVACSDCYNFTSLNAGTVVFNVSSWSNYSIGDGAVDVTVPQVTINLPLNATYNALPIPFNITLNENGTVRYSLNNGITNHTMSSTDNRNFNASNTSIGDGSYTVKFYANDTFGNMNSTMNRTFSVLITNLTECRILDDANTVYTLQRNISLSVNNGRCFRILADNITIDGNGYTINTTGNFLGQWGIESINRQNITIKNLSITRFTTGIYTQQNVNLTLSNINLYSNTNGMGDAGSIYSVFANLNISSNSQYGVDLFYGPTSYNVYTNITSYGNSYGIALGAHSEGGISNSTISNIYSNSNTIDLYVEGTSYNITFQNYNIGTYRINFAAASKFIFENTTLGRIDLLDEFSTEGTSRTLDNDLIILNNSLYYNFTSSSSSITTPDVASFSVYGYGSGSNYLIDDYIQYYAYAYNTTNGITVYSANPYYGEYQVAAESEDVVLEIVVPDDVEGVRILTDLGGDGIDGGYDVTSSGIYYDDGSIPWDGSDTVTPTSLAINANASANISLYGILTNFTRPIVLKDGNACTDCVNYTSLNAGNVKFRTIQAGNYSIGESAEDVTAPQVTINLPLNATYNSLPVVFNVTLNENGTVRYSLNNGITNHTMSSTDNRNFNASNTSIGDGSYTVKFYANDTFGNMNSTMNRTFSVLITNLTQCRVLNDVNTIYYLQNNITNTVNNARCFEITANNVTLDGQGYTVSSSVNGFGVDSSSNQYVTIKNLSVTGFVSGILTQDNINMSLININSYLNTYGIVETRNYNSNVSNINSYSNQFGLELYGYNTYNSYNNINTSLNEVGITLGASDDAGLSNNTFVNVNANYNTLDLFARTSSDNVTFRNYNIGTYEIHSEFNSKFIFENTTFGKIEILEGFNTSSSTRNLDNDLIIYNNSIYYNFTESISANISLYGILTNFTNPAVLNNGTFCNECINYTSLNAGSVRFGTLQAGNYSIGEDSRDTTAPQVTINSPTGNLSVSQVTFNVTTNENASSALFSLNGGITNVTMQKNGNRDFNYTNSSIGDGNYVVRFYVNDTSGNWNRSESRAFTIDTTAPATTFGVGTEDDTSTITRNNIVVNISAIDTTSGLANITIRLYNSTSLLYTNVSATSPFRINYTGLNNGVYYFNSTAYDNFGNANNTATRSVTINVVSYQLNDCTIISNSGSYNITSDISSNGAGACLNIIADNVILNGLGNSVSRTNGIALTSNAANLSIHNISLTGSNIDLDLNNTNTSLNNSYVEAYNLTNAKINVINVYGNVSFLNRFNASGINLSSDVQISSNLSVISNNVNASALVTLTGVTYSGKYPSKLQKVVRNNERCLDCTNITSTTVSTIIFNVSGSGNYTVGKSVVSQSNVSLGQGWNAFSIKTKNNNSASNVTISLSPGYNLIGYSSETEIAQADVKFRDSDGERTLNSAAGTNKMRKNFAYFDAAPGQKKYKYAPISDTRLRKGNAYWVYVDDTNATGTVNITIPGAGGSPTNETYRWNELMFSNGTSELNITDAYISGWFNISSMNSLIQKWDTSSGEPSEYTFTAISPAATLNAWEGYFIKTNKTEIQLLRQD